MVGDARLELKLRPTLSKFDLRDQISQIVLGVFR